MTEAPQETLDLSKEDRRLANIEMLQKMGVLIALVILCFVFSMLAGDRFFTLQNFFIVARQVSFYYICGVGMTFIMITGNIDLAVGSYIALSGIFAAKLLEWGVEWYLVLVASMIALGLVQCLVGLAVAKQRLPSFIVTLAMMSAARGASLAWSSGIPVPVKPDKEVFRMLGTGYLGPIPWPVIIAFIVMVIGQFVLRKTKFGRYVYAVGGNEQAAVTSGLNVTLVKVGVFAIAGMLTALVGCLMAARLFSGNPTTGQGFELEVIAAVVIGGTSMTGGYGGMVGTLIGAFTVGVIANGLTILGVDYSVQFIVKGAIIYLAVWIDTKTKTIVR